MPDYDFRALSPVDFEHLTRDILNIELGLKLQGYAAGRDQGIDLRHVSDDGTVTVVQCKHYLDSSSSTFMRAVRQEGSRGHNLRVDRYIFVTSRDLSVLNQDQVVTALHPLGVTHNDVWGRNRLNEALARNPDIERAHIKLWLSSAGVLDTLLNSGRWQRGEATLDAVRDRAKLWVHTPAYDEALNVLQREGVCIVYGPPGTGKTFLAEMMLLAAVAEGWTAVHVSGDVEEAWRAFQPSQNQIFYYDDFLGEGRLELAKKESSRLADFIARVRQFKEHKRLILTTREQIFQQGAGEYDALRHLLQDSRRLGVRLNQYPARIRAEMLFNQLYFSNIPEDERKQIVVDNRILSIIGHAAYNPRLIEIALRTALHGPSDEKLNAIEHALDNPESLWDISFRNLEYSAQRILLTMASLPARPWPLRTIRELAVVGDGLAWRPALRTLEATWLTIMGQPSDKYVTLANPSCRDYLLSILDDAAVAEAQVTRIRCLDQITSLSRSAGVLPDTQLSFQRSELAQALWDERTWLTELIRIRADTEDATGGGRVKVLRDAAALLYVYGEKSDTTWLMERIDSLIVLIGQGLDVHPPDAFLLAERLAMLEAESPRQRDLLAEKLVMRAVEAIQTSGHLDAYEALPQKFWTPDVHEAARQRAHTILADEADHLIHSINDPETIRVGAADIEQRAAWYGLDVNVGPLLDRANNGLAAESEATPWPKTKDKHDDTDSTNAAEVIRQIFSRFSQ